MLRNYLLIAARNLYRQLSYSLINITGLAIGIACSLVMFLFVYTEWSYDRHFANAERIYKVGVSFFNMGNFAVGPEVLGDVLPADFAGVEAFTRIKQQKSLAIQVDETAFIEKAYFTDSSFFRIFSYQFIEGDRRTALASPGSIVITASMASKYFGDQPAMGKTLLIGKEKTPYAVTGIVRDETNSSQLQSSIWISDETQRKHEKIWTSAGFYCYVLLKESSTEQDLREALERIREKQAFVANPLGSKTLAEYDENPLAVKFHVNALTDVHLKSKLMFEISPTGNETNMYAFAGLSIFIIVLASVNFINLTTARASRRAKEVGIRKAVGSSRSRLVTQFTIESMLVTVIALLFALALAELFLGLFQVVTGDRLVNILWTNGPGIVGVILFALVIGFVSGIYPAFYLTSFKPANVLKGKLATGQRGTFRNALVVFQFTISISLMICSAVIFRQMNFMQTKDLGFDQENVITIDGVFNLKDKADGYKQVLLRQAGVQKASLHSGEPGSKAIITINVFETPGEPQGHSISTFTGDHELIDFMGYRLLEGRAFNKDLVSDSSAVILNEAAVKSLDLKNPIGAKLGKDQYVIGVVGDFHWESLRSTIAPVAITLGGKSQLGIKIEPSQAAAFLKTAEAEWKKLAPDEPFKYHFLDENFGAMLNQEKIFSNAIGFFTALAILVSCLGLYGLSAFTAEQRTKEIGIRKVLGANVADIVGMLNGKFSVLVLIAVVLAVPVSVMLMNQWMEGFAYQSGLQWWVFAISIVLGFVVALITVSFHSVRAALINPAETLKYE